MSDDALTQRLLAIPGVELVASFDPVEVYGKKPAEEKKPPRPSRTLLFSRDWICFSLHDDQDVAAQAFERRTGRKPEFVYQDFSGGLLWVGPV